MTARRPSASWKGKKPMPFAWVTCFLVSLVFAPLIFIFHILLAAQVQILLVPIKLAIRSRSSGSVHLTVRCAIKARNARPIPMLCCCCGLCKRTPMPHAVKNDNHRHIIFVRNGPPDQIAGLIPSVTSVFLHACLTQENLFAFVIILRKDLEVEDSRSRTNSLSRC